MPNRLPIKPRAKAIEAPKSARARETAQARERTRSVDWFALWAISLGLAAIGVALIAYLTVGDKVVTLAHGRRAGLRARRKSRSDPAMPAGASAATSPARTSTSE